jgi:hypothetical protein
MTPEGSREVNYFRESAANLANLQQSQILFESKTKFKLRYPVNVDRCLPFSLHNFEQDLQGDILAELRTDAGIGADHEAGARLPLFLCGPTREAFEDLYVRDAALRLEVQQERMTIAELMNLDGGGRKIRLDRSRDGAWLTPNARRKGKQSPVEVRGIAVFDGPRAWERWGDILRRSTRILVFSRSSSALRHERMKTILVDNIDRRLGVGLSEDRHSWFQDRTPIRAFVHQWQ